MGWHIFDASAAGLKAVSIAVDAKVSSMRGSIQRRTHRGECSSKLNWNIAKTEVFAVQTLWLHSLGLRLSLPVLNAWKRPIFMHKLEQSCRICKQQTKARCAYAMLTNKTSWNWNKQSTNTLGTHTTHRTHTTHNNEAILPRYEHSSTAPLNNTHPTRIRPVETPQPHPHHHPFSHHPWKHPPLSHFCWWGSPPARLDKSYGRKTNLTQLYFA